MINVLKHLAEDILVDSGAADREKTTKPPSMFVRTRLRTAITESNTVKFRQNNCDSLQSRRGTRLFGYNAPYNALYFVELYFEMLDPNLQTFREGSPGAFTTAGN